MVEACPRPLSHYPTLDGIVVHVQDGFTESGRDPDLLERSNLVVVGHSDGTLAFYGHLSPGIPVAVGDPSGKAIHQDVAGLQGSRDNRTCTFMSA